MMCWSWQWALFICNTPHWKGQRKPGMEPHTCNPDSEKAETNPGYSIKPWYKTKKGGWCRKYTEIQMQIYRLGPGSSACESIWHWSLLPTRTTGYDPITAPCTLVAEKKKKEIANKQMKLELNWQLPHCYQEYTGPKYVMQTIRKEKSSSAMSTVNCNTNVPGKMCSLVQ